MDRINMEHESSCFRGTKDIQGPTIMSIIRLPVPLQCSLEQDSAARVVSCIGRASVSFWSLWNNGGLPNDTLSMHKIPS
jgi:hypothetical protein